MLVTLSQNSSVKRARSNSSNANQAARRAAKRQRLSRGREELRGAGGFDEDVEIEYEVPTEIAFILPSFEDLIPTQVAFHPKDDGLLLGICEAIFFGLIKLSVHQTRSPVTLGRYKKGS